MLSAGLGPPCRHNLAGAAERAGRLPAPWREQDPSKSIPNHAPPPRSQVWREYGIARIAKCAWRDGYAGLATRLVIVRDGMMRPVDARTVKASHIITDGTGRAFELAGQSLGKRPLPRSRTAPGASSPLIASDGPSLPIRRCAARGKAGHPPGRLCQMSWATACRKAWPCKRPTRPRSWQFQRQEGAEAARYRTTGPERISASGTVHYHKPLKEWRERRDLNPRPPA